MAALSIRNRFEWALVGLVISAPFFYITYYMYVNEGPSAGVACYFTGIMGIFFVRQFLFVPPNISLRRWWDNATRPGYYAVPESGGSMKIIRHVFCDFNEVYALNGDLIGHEQDVWNDGHWTFKPVDVDSRERMPLIAFWRTKRQKPVGNLAEVISYDDTIVGHTTYTEHH